MHPHAPQHQPRSTTPTWAHRFAALPKGFFEHSVTLTPSETNVYLFIVDRLNGKTRTGWTIPIADAEIVEATGYRRETVNIARNNLARKEMLIQQDSQLRAKRVFFIAPPAQVYQMKLIFLALLLKEARRTGIQVQTYERTITLVCESHHTSVSKPSHNVQEANAVTPVVERVSDNTVSRSKDIACKDISKNSLSCEHSSETKQFDTKENTERESFAGEFYQTVLNRPLTNKKKQIGINKYFKRRIVDIVADERVESEQQACEILKDAFVRVKQEVYPIHSHKIFDVEFGESAIEKAICASQKAARGDVSPDTGVVESETPQTDAPIPPQAQVDAALLKTWDDKRWEAWVDVQVADRVKVREMICAQFPGREPLTDSELATMRCELLARYPADGAQRLVWLKQQIEHIQEV